MSGRWGWAGSHPQAGAVRVRSDHREAISWHVASAHSEGDEAGEVPGHKVLKRAEDQSHTTHSSWSLNTWLTETLSN